MVCVVCVCVCVCDDICVCGVCVWCVCVAFLHYSTWEISIFFQMHIPIPQKAAEQEKKQNHTETDKQLGAPVLYRTTLVQVGLAYGW